jgi:hypothetical protein
MIGAYVLVTASDDYLVRREPHRRAHVERLLALRGQGLVIAAGPAPDGRTAEVFYRTSDRAQVERLVEDDPYTQAGVWTAFTVRGISALVEPTSEAPVSLDGSRRVTIVEAPTTDPGAARLALVELRATGRLAFGGVLDDGRTLAVVACAEEGVAVGLLAETGLWSAEGLTPHPWLYVL